MFRYIRDQITRDKDYPQRTYTIDVLARIRDGLFYDHLAYGFHEEENQAGEYTKLRDRRPSVRHPICRTVVDDSISLLFDEGHFPHIETGDDGDAKAEIARLVKGTKLNEVMIEAATIGSTGSVAVFLQALKQADGTHRLFYTPSDTRYLTPDFDPKNPRKLAKITEQYKVLGSELKARGYTVDDKELRTLFWFRVEWDERRETRYKPWKVRDPTRTADFKPEIDADRSLEHGLGFVPWVWVKNLPGRLPEGGPFDGECTFRLAIDTNIEIDYLLSQGGRGLKYASDPTLLIKEPAVAENGEIIKSPANAITVSKDGDAKMLEIDGTASTALLAWVENLRKVALESIHGNRADADKLATAQSGRAMELMNQALIWLADKLRISYGQGALLDLVRMACAAHAKYPLSIEEDDGEVTRLKLPKTPKLSLRWPRYYPPTATDRQADETAIAGYVAANIMSRQTAIRCIAADFDIDDAEAELKLIAAEQALEDKRQLDLEAKRAEINADDANEGAAGAE